MGAGLQGFQGYAGYQGSQGNILSTLNTFDYEYYLLLNEDVQDVFHSNDDAIWYDHWLKYGQYENRPHRFWRYTIGFQGSQGSQGAQGAQGVQGYIGDLGLFGVQGFQGDQGYGPQGFQGTITGNDGFTGWQGKQGIVGDPGVRGYQGNTSVSAGLQGNQGFQGFQGGIGLSGFQGVDGNVGNNGNSGFQGFQGNVGRIGNLIGFQGNIDTEGNQGVQGFQGWIGDGSPSTGLQGNQGLQSGGITGSQGYTGFDGNSAINIGPQGNQGDQGDGTQGARGLRGNDGYMGPQGFSGGIQGDVGNQGNQGIQGSQGTNDIPGNEGFQGHQGFQGNSGVIGNDGYKGNDGNIGNQGFQGNGGIRGFQGGGGNGAQGNQGFQGNIGADGFQGVDGFQGNQGFQGGGSGVGPQGVQGSQGNKGTQGLLQPYIEKTGISNTNLTFSTYTANDIVSITTAPLSVAGAYLGGSGTDSINGQRPPLLICCGSSGIVYVGGNMNCGTNGTGNNPFDFAGNTITGYASTVFYIAGFNSIGTQVFFKFCGGGDGTGNMIGLQCDSSSGTVFCVGQMQQSTSFVAKDFSGNTISMANNSNGVTNVFCGALDSTGTQQFFKVTGSNISAVANVACYYSQTLQSIYVCGMYNTSSSLPKDFDGNTVTGIGNTDIFLAKLTSSGTQTYYKFAGSTASDTQAGTPLILTESSGSFIFCSFIVDASATVIGFNGVTVATSGINIGCFCAGLDSAGTQQFFKVAGTLTTTRASNQILDLTTDSSNNVYIAGVFNYGTSGGKDFAGNSAPGYTTGTTSTRNLFASSIATTGTQRFFSVAGYASAVGQNGTNFKTYPSIRINSNYDVFFFSGILSNASIFRDFAGNTVSGFASSGYDICLAGLNSIGTQQFFKICGGSNDDIAGNLELDPTTGIVYVSGVINTDVTTKDFNGDTTSGYGGLDVFTSGMNSSGTQQFFKVSGGSSDDTVQYQIASAGNILNSIIFTNNSQIYVTGLINCGTGGTGNLPVDFNGNAVTGYGAGIDIFLAGFDTTGHQLTYRLMGVNGVSSSNLPTDIATMTTGGKAYVYIQGLITPSALPYNLDGTTLGSGITYSGTESYVTGIPTAQVCPIGIAATDTAGGTTDVVLMGVWPYTGAVQNSFYYFDNVTGITTGAGFRYRVGFGSGTNELSFHVEDTAI